MCQAYAGLSRVYDFFERVKCSCGHYHLDHGPKRTKETASQTPFIGAVCASWIPYSNFKVCKCKKCDCREYCQKKEMA